MELVILGAGERSNTGGLREKLRQPPGRYPSICIPALRRGLDWMALEVPFDPMILLGLSQLETFLASLLPVVGRFALLLVSAQERKFLPDGALFI